MGSDRVELRRVMVSLVGGIALVKQNLRLEESKNENGDLQILIGLCTHSIVGVGVHKTFSSYWSIFCLFFFFVSTYFLLANFYSAN